MHVMQDGSGLPLHKKRNCFTDPERDKTQTGRRSRFRRYSELKPVSKSRG